MADYLITGCNGQLGTELCHLLDEQGIAYTAFDSQGMDITDRDQVMKVITQEKPQVIFHCAAFTAVDAAEDEKRDLNWQVNVDGTQNVADAAKKVGAKLVYISTDYVFDGTNQGEYQVDAPTNPKNEYGKAKLAGEQAVENTLTDYYIIRTSWVFGQYGHNFVFTMLKLAETYDKLTVVDDQVGRPTWTRTLAEFMLHLVQTNAPFGMYQLSNDGDCSWFKFASEILKDHDVDVQPVTSEQYPQKAYRPRHSVMSLEKAKATGFTIPTWQEALQQFLADVTE
ncbi:dTDP-4-dehydrorhamnose reductase [Limosilactobacillus caecicola]|uniref:dTDP-4-dehydrorhamnose reductase n=1 Tax=Limosilactobacillus caecicola TaxID=2941332 RepID=UPI00203F207D|nr:dTDP-4-dehydrorhamnose reductase [Limosilactobacillus caecicola]